MPAAALCTNCGMANREGARFCAVCGAAFGASAFFTPRHPHAAAQAAPIAGSATSGLSPSIEAAAAQPAPAIGTLSSNDAAIMAELFAARVALPNAALRPRPATPAPPIVAATALATANPATARAVPFGGDSMRRETFYAAQRRHRRRARLLSLLTGLPVLLLAVFVAALISPWLLLIAAGGLRLLRLAGPLHGPPRDTAQLLDGLMLPVRAWFDSKPVRPDSVVRLMLALLAPSIVILLLTWLWVKAAFRHASARGTLARMATRSPNSADPLELRLVNISEEMAVAAGITPPMLLLVDGSGANAAILGSSYRDCTLVVSRALLDALNRDETEGVVAELIGSAGNGDLGLAAAILSVFQTIGLVLAARDVLLSRIARRTVWRFLVFSLWRGDATRRAARAAGVSDLMLRSTTIEGLDTAQTRPGEDASLGKLGCITVWPFMATAMFRMFMLFYMKFITGPLLGWIWRTRRYLADATAVQLTRNPDALAGALQHLPLYSTRIAGGGSADLLFVVQPNRGGSIDPALAASLRARRDEIVQRAAGQGLAARMGAMRDLQLEMAAELAKSRAASQAASAADTPEESVSDELGMSGLYPPGEKRLRRLEAMGAHIDRGVDGVRRQHPWWAYPLIVLVITPVAALLLLAFGMIAAFAACANALLAMPVLALVSWLARAALH